MILVELHGESVVRKQRCLHGQEKEGQSKRGGRHGLQMGTSMNDWELVFLYN